MKINEHKKSHGTVPLREAGRKYDIYVRALLWYLYYSLIPGIVHISSATTQSIMNNTCTGTYELDSSKKNVKTQKTYTTQSLLDFGFFSKQNKL